MRYKIFYTALVLEAIFCMIFALPQMQVSGMFTTITAFPFEQIAGGCAGFLCPGGSAMQWLLHSICC